MRYPFTLGAHKPSATFNRITQAITHSKHRNVHHAVVYLYQSLALNDGNVQLMPSMRGHMWLTFEALTFEAVIFEIMENEHAKTHHLNECYLLSVALVRTTFLEILIRMQTLFVN